MTDSQTAWQYRSIPAFTHLTLIALFLVAFGDLRWLLTNGASQGLITATWLLTARSVLQWTIAICMIVIQLLAGGYTLRLCWATFWTTREIARLADGASQDGFAAKGNEYPVTTGLRFAGPVIHAILIPSYKEHVETMRETLNVLASHRSAGRRYDIFLAMEEKDPNAEKVALILTDAFRHKFRDIQHTVHPFGLPGESQGKSSNISWAAKQVSLKYRESAEKEDVLLTVMDADSHLSPMYFRQLTRLHRENADPDSRELSYYMPPIIFDRNSHSVPPFVRTADLLWCGAAMSGIYPGSSIAPPASVYSLSLTLADRVGGWDTGPEAIGEDLHMYLKCYFATRGAIKVRPIYSAASQCDACSDEPGFHGFIGSLQARWSQAVRHMWGSLDTGFAVRQGIRMWKTRSTSDGAGPRLLKHILLFHRMFEAHFLPMLIPLTVVAAAVYPVFVPPVLTPPALLFAFNVTAQFRNICFGIMMFWFYLYEHFHYLCVSIREFEMTKAGMRDDVEFTYRRGWIYWLDWFIFPIAGVMFGALPAVKAQWSLIFSDRLGYQVTLKPIKALFAAQDGTV